MKGLASNAPKMSLKPISKQKAKNNIITIGSIVEYENHGKPMLSIVTASIKDKFEIINSSEKNLKFPATRLYLYPGLAPKGLDSNSRKANFLVELQEKANTIKEMISLEEAWLEASKNHKEISIIELTTILLDKNSTENHIATRHALLEDKVFFKRKKQNYEPRPSNIVEELKKKEKVEKEKREKQELLITSIVNNIKGEKSDIPRSVHLLEQASANGKNSPTAKEANVILEEVAKRANLELSGRLEHRAFFVLEKAGHFSKDQDLNLLRYKRKNYFSSRVLDEAEKLSQSLDAIDATGKKDLQHLMCVTIDSESTKDLDDAISCEETENSYIIGVHICQVAYVIEENSELEKEIFNRASSIYCADQTIPMLPSQISEHSLSLVEGESRQALSYFIEISKDYEVLSTNICQSIIRVEKRLSFDDVNGILYDQDNIGSQEIQDLVFKLWQVSSELETKRMMRGAIQFSRREMLAKVGPDQKISLEVGSDDTPAHKLVGEFMIMANEIGALYARDHKIPLIFRTQEAPEVDVNEQGKHITEGPARDFFKRSFLKRSLLSNSAMPHSSLGLEAYAQLTSPLRRVSDYINQKQLISFLRDKSAFYSAEKIKEFIDLTETKVAEVFQIQRQRNRFWLLKYLQQEKIKEITGLVIRVDGPKQLAELDMLYAIYAFTSANQEKKRLGETVRLKIEKIDPRNDRLVLSEVV